VKLYTNEADVLELRKQAQAVYADRDARLAGMTDEDVETFYSCLLCQSFAPSHVCVVSPERPGLCGAYSWLDCRAAHEITPAGPNQPITKGNCVEPKIGQWDKVNAFVSPPAAARSSE
jgi:acetyl-CoA synthase